MNRRVAKHAISVAVCIVASMPFAGGRAADEADPVFGIRMFPGYRDWRLISVAHEGGKLDDLRAVLGNDAAVDAAR
jgi:hypothetical protein